MPIRVKCRSCSKEIRLKDSAAGKTIKCPDCGGKVRVPEPEPVEEEWDDYGDEYADDEYEAPQPRRRNSASRGSGTGRKKKGRKSSKNSNSTPLIIGGAVAGVAVIGVLVAMLWPGENGNDPGGGGEGTVAATDGDGSADATTASPSGTAGSSVAGTSPAGNADSQVIAAPANSTGWPLAADPSVLPWGETTNVTDSQAVMGLTFSNAPTAAVSLGYGSSKIGLQGSRAMNLATGEKIGAIEAVTPEAGKKSLSPDGTTLAFIHGVREQRHQVSVWSYATGNKVKTIDVEKSGEEVKSISLASPTQLLAFSDTRVDGKSVRILKLFDVAAGTLIKQLAFENAFNLTHCTISPGGKYLAYLIDNNNLLILEVESLEIVASTRFNHSAISQSKGVAFNPSGDKIACGFLNDNKTRILVVDFATGASTVAAEFIGDMAYSPISGSIYLGTSLEWLPGDKGWCVSGSCIVDAESGRVVWFIDSASRLGSQRRRPAPDGLLVPAGSLIDRKLTLVPIPWDSIRESMAAAPNDAEALLREGSGVSVQVEVGSLAHGEADQTKSELTESLTQRLSADGLTVAENSAVTLYAHYSEKAGHMASSMRDRTQQVQTTNALIKLEWRNSDGKPIRSIETTVNPSFVQVKEFTAAAYRNAMFEKAKKQVASCQFPFYIPSGTEHQILPGLTIYEQADAGRP